MCRYLLLLLLIGACTSSETETVSGPYTISRAAYADQLYGFWLAQCIGNWTGLVTEMDKIGDIGEIRTGAFYTRADWGRPDQPNIWSEDGSPSELSPTIDFVLRGPDSIWGADDDTDIEYMYQHLTANSPNVVLTPEQIRDGWLRHIRTEEENYLWVSNQRALDLMRDSSLLPPATSEPIHNEHYAMIDAQLTTEIFGLFAPTSPAVALELAHLPIRVAAAGEAEQIARFYVHMHSLAAAVDNNWSNKQKTQWLAAQARAALPSDGYPAAMYDYVEGLYEAGLPWEQARDSVYVRYQVEQADGYDVTSQNLYCNGCFAAGINYAASLVSLFYGEGDLRETIKIGTLAGWDSDNPTATWAGLIGFLIGKEGVEAAFPGGLSDRFNIHRTRQGFPREGIDTFGRMAAEGVGIVDRVVVEKLGGTVEGEVWVVPSTLIIRK